MNIVIRNYLAASFLLEREPKAWDAVVILDSGMRHTGFVEEHAGRHVYLHFDDVDSRNAGKRPPTTDDIRSALEFAADSENLLVSCRAGQSRSAATAFVICFDRLGPEAACRLLNPQRHVPNPMIVDLAARLIDDPLLLPTFRKWQSDNKQVNLSEYLDDIEREFDELESQGARNRIVSC